MEFAKNEDCLPDVGELHHRSEGSLQRSSSSTRWISRIADGKIVEHWDGARKVVDTDFGARSKGGGGYNTSTNLSPREQETRALGMIEFKDILQHGHTDLAMSYMAPGYMQHNVNVLGGRDNFIKKSSNREKIPLADARRTPPTLEPHHRQLLPEVGSATGGSGRTADRYYPFDMGRGRRPHPGTLGRAFERNPAFKLRHAGC